jgi:hypothetical protein
MAAVFRLLTYLRGDIYIVSMRRKPLPEPMRDMLRLVLAEVQKTPRGERKRVAVQQMWLRMEAAQGLTKTLKMPVDRLWLAMINEVEASGDPLEVLRRHLGGEVPAERRQKAEAPEPPDLGLVEERLALFENAVEEVLRDPEGVERGIYKRAEFFEAFFRWAKSALRGDLPERLGVKLKAALEVAYYCRPGGLMYAAKEVEEGRKPLPPEHHPGVYAVKRYAKTWLKR